VRSATVVLARTHFIKGQEVNMSTRQIWAGLAAVFGGLQAWDAGAFGAGGGVAALTAIGLAAPIGAILATESSARRVAALAAGFVLITWARFAAPVSLNTLHVSLVFAAFYILFVSRWVEGQSAAHAR
jgi:hypothetical protein